MKTCHCNRQLTEHTNREFDVCVAKAISFKMGFRDFGILKTRAHKDFPLTSKERVEIEHLCGDIFVQWTDNADWELLPHYSTDIRDAITLLSNIPMIRRHEFVHILNEVISQRQGTVRVLYDWIFYLTPLDLCHATLIERSD